MINKKIIKIGIIGGLGPLASASFVETFYTSYLQNESLKENYYSPCVYLYSEPLMTQLSATLSIHQSEAELLEKLEKNIEHLIIQGVDSIVICCFTAHILIPKLLPRQQKEVYSLVSFVLKHVLAQKLNLLFFPHRLQEKCEY